MVSRKHVRIIWDALTRYLCLKYIPDPIGVVLVQRGSSVVEWRTRNPSEPGFVSPICYRFKD